MKNNSVLIMIVIAVVFGGAGFFAGKSYDQSQVQAQRIQMAGQFGNRAGGTPGAGRIGAGARGGQVLGTILSQGNNSITVQMADGSSKIVLLSATTSINQAVAAIAADLKVGEKVSAFGTANPDGSVTAQNVQINPIMINRGGLGTPSGVPTGK